MAWRPFFVVLVPALISCAAHSDLISGTGVGATGNGSTLLVVVDPADVEGRSCWADVTITAIGEADVVRLDVRGRRAHGPDCTPRSKMRVTLPQPLGERTVRDGATGQPASLLPLSQLRS